jgi:hypothetical protein
MADQHRIHKEELARQQQANDLMMQGASKKEIVLHSNIALLQSQLAEAQANAHNYCELRKLSFVEVLHVFFSRHLIYGFTQPWRFHPEILELPCSRPSNVRWLKLIRLSPLECPGFVFSSRLRRDVSAMLLPHKRHLAHFSIFQRAPTYFGV